MKNTFFVLTALLLLSCSHNGKLSPSGTSSKSPLLAHASTDLSKLDFTQNEAWETITSHLEKSSQIDEEIKEYLPVLDEQIQKDKNDPYLLMIWGESKTHEKDQLIVNDKILETINDYFNQPTRKNYAHAGVLHTYAYLFSHLNTPYGYKRSRWINPTIGHGLKISPHLLGPESKEGTLLSNLTYLAGMFALKENHELQLLKNVANEIKTLSYETYKKIIITEKNSRYTFKSVLVEFRDNSQESSHLLIYTFEDQRIKKEVLITAFPISLNTFHQLVNPKKLGAKKKIGPRYNLYLPTLESEFEGERSLQVVD